VCSPGNQRSHLLTGGGEGIGAECALAYVREGATVAILDRNREAADNFINIWSCLTELLSFTRLSFSNKFRTFGCILYSRPW
jgi:NAD(P)-dependent dehydrogenase (short-subunit alcohol dehydrogenase family)